METKKAKKEKKSQKEKLNLLGDAAYYIRLCFDWEATREGFDFWVYVAKRLEKISKGEKLK
jgi:hypothetical protein